MVEIDFEAGPRGDPIVSAATEKQEDALAAAPATDWRQRLLGLAALLAVVAIVAPLSRRSINLSDEGYILLQALDMVRGKVLYKDMDAFVSPGIWFLLSALFRVVEPSVLASRALSLGAYVATVGVAYHIVARLTQRTYALACVGMFVIFVVWAFPIWTWTFYSPFAVMFCLFGLAQLLRFGDSGSQRDLFWLGIAFGLAITFKQNYGVFGLVGALFGLAAFRRQADFAPASLPANLGAIALGGFAIGLPVIGYLVVNDAVGAAFKSLVVQPFVFAGQHSVPYLGPTSLFESGILGGTDRLTYGATSIYNIGPPFEWVRTTRILERMHVVLYQVPPVLFALGAWLSFRRSPSSGRRQLDAPLFATLAVAAMIFLGVFPRADYNHLMNVYQPILVLGAVIAHRFAKTYPAPHAPSVVAVRTTATVLLTAYAIVGAYWYWHTLSEMNAKVTPKRGGILERPYTAEKLNQLVEVVWANTRDGDSLLSVPDLAMINFLAERDMPSPYYNLYQHHIAHDGGAAVVEGSRSSATRLAVARYNGFFSDTDRLRDYAPALVDHLDRDFGIQFTAAADNFIFLLARPRPLPERDYTRLLETCVPVSRAQESDYAIREHLLFTTLYQDEGPHHEAKEWIEETRCEVELPDNDPQLLVRPDVYPPQYAEPGATLTFELLVERDDKPAASVLRYRTDVKMPASFQLVRRWPKERRADLSPFAGEKVTLVFRSHRRGVVLRNPTAYQGYSSRWIDPRIVPRAQLRR